MELYDWLLFLHVLSAFVVVAALTGLWALIVATRPERPVLLAEQTVRVGRIGGVLVGVGMMGTIVFGIWLALDDDRYEIWDGWIIAALVLWLLAGWSGDRTGKSFERDPVGGRRDGIRFHALSSVAIFVILVLMIWKPGA